MTQKQNRPGVLENPGKIWVEKIMNALQSELKSRWGDQVVGIVQFGSTVRAPVKKETDIDVFIVFRELEAGRRIRFEKFYPVEESLQPLYKAARNDGYHLELSPVLKSVTEFSRFSVLYLDMVEESRIWLDSIHLIQRVLDKTQQWIAESGAKKVKRGLKWYWVLKPDVKEGEEFEIGFGTLPGSK